MAITKIVVPVDFSDLSKPLVEYAGQFAKCMGAKVFLIHITQVQQIAEMFGDLEGGLPALAEPEVMHQIKEAAKKQLDTYRQQLKAMDLMVEAVVLAGVNYMEIIQYAKDQAADLIIIGSHGKSGWQDFLLGNVADKVAHKSPIPVLIFKPRMPKNAA